MCSSRGQSHLKCHCRMLPLQQYPSEYQRHFLIPPPDIVQCIIIISIIIYQLSFSFCQFFVFVSSITTQQFNNHRTVQQPHKQFETCGKIVKTRFHPPLTVMFCALLTCALSVYLVSVFFSGPSQFPFSALTLFPGLFTVPLMRMTDLLSRQELLN